MTWREVQSIIKTGIVFSDKHDPWHNLALEEYLLNRVKKRDVLLYLWQNQNTVVIGRNQNAWKECRCRLLEEEGGNLARRLSGGGAVYHDLGNLNFTFVMRKELYDLEKQLEVILAAVRSQGIDAEFSGRNDLVVTGKKFSGNAFYLGSPAVYHHGTILVDTDFEKMTRYLQVSKEKIETKGIDSVRSRVINLRQLNSELTINEMKKAMARSFQEKYGGKAEEVILHSNENEEIKRLTDKYSDWDWLYGKTPEFDITFNRRFEWGDIELGLTAKKGYIDRAVIYSDAMNADLIQNIAKKLEGIPFNIDDITGRIKTVDIDAESEKIIYDLVEWIEKKSL